MENTFLYLLKVNGLLVVFFLAYYFLLRKETFFHSNRWFLLIGIISSFVLPSLLFTNIVWIEAKPIANETINNLLPIAHDSSISNIEKTNHFNWYQILACIYFIISSVLLFKLFIEIISFFKIVKKGQKSKLETIKIIETNENHNPFSFFNYLIYSKSNFTDEELKYIFIHERVHIEEKHSIDVLLSKVLCLLFWINPVAWLYKKAILENLEFIADYRTTKITNNPYNYQKTLLKTINNKNQLSITNQFYQSLIKKRIVMLNTNQSNKKNLWKYSIVVPFLVAFVFFFQIETIAQEKKQNPESKNIEKKSKTEFEINKNTTDKSLNEITSIFKNKHNLNLEFNTVKRNKNNEIIKIKASSNIGKTYNSVIELENKNGISPFIINIKEDNYNNKNVVFTNTESSSINIQKNKISSNEDSNITNYGKWKVEKYLKDDKPVLFVVNGEKLTPGSNIKLDKGFAVIHSKELNAEEANKKYGSQGKNGAYELIIEEMSNFSNFPSPPSFPMPPSHPYKNLKTPPSPPEFPNVPELPSNLDDEKEMKKFDKKMKDFEKKMEKLEPQIKKFEKEMEAFEKEMEAHEPNIEAYEKEIKIYEEQMKIYEKEIEKHLKKLENKN